jgi:HlyD family secretion protein
VVQNCPVGLRNPAFWIHIRRMTKNSWPFRTAWLAAVFGLAACGQARAGERAPLQGIVEHEDSRIGFEVTGRVLSVEVERGAEIKPDTVLVRLDDSLEAPLRDLRAAELAIAEAQLRLLKAGARGEEIRAAQAEVSALQSQADILDKNLKRQQGLFTQSALAQSVVDDTAAQLQSTNDRRNALEERLKALRSGARGDEIAAAVARVQGAQAALAAQAARLTRFVLRSTTAGSVIDRHVEPGEWAAPGAPAVTLADLAHPYVDVFVPQGRAHELGLGDSMQVVVDGVNAPLAGKIEHIFPRTEFTPRYLFSEGERENLVVRMRVRVDDPKRVLHAGVPAFVTPARIAGAES